MVRLTEQEEKEFNSRWKDVVFPRKLNTPIGLSNNKPDSSVYNNKDYLVAMRAPTFQEEKANPSLKSVPMKIVNRKFPSLSFDPEDLGIKPPKAARLGVSSDSDMSKYFTITGAEQMKKEKWKSSDTATKILGKEMPEEKLFEPFKPRNPDNSLYITDSKGSHLFTLKGKSTKEDTITTRRLYSEKKQWFAPEADNYMPISKIDKNITKNKSLNHFSSDEIFKFADTNRNSSDFFQGGSGDWKHQKNGGNDYLMSTVDGKPYWTDAIGQVPYAIDTYKKIYKITNSPATSRMLTSVIGKLEAAGAELRDVTKGKQNIKKVFDFSNSYDNAMINKATHWATNKYKNKIPSYTYDYIMPFKYMKSKTKGTSGIINNITLSDKFISPKNIKKSSYQDGILDTLPITPKSILTNNAR